MTDGQRRCMVLRGEPDATRSDAEALLTACRNDDVLWVDQEGLTRFTHSAPRQTRTLLGRAFDVVVLSVHNGIDVDAIGCCQGLIWGGGCLILRMPPEGTMPAQDGTLAAYPFTAEDVGHRMMARIEQSLVRHPAAVTSPRPIFPGRHTPSGTAGQLEVVEALTTAFSKPCPSVSTVISERGRGKSSAVGLALRNAQKPGARRIAITAAAKDAAAEVIRFAGDTAQFMHPAQLTAADNSFDIIAVDEAARLPVPLLQRLFRRHPGAHFVFSTTTRGYEGTGRGFVLRFMNWLRQNTPKVDEYTLTEPIRWGPNDRLEALIFDMLALLATPASIPVGTTLQQPTAVSLSQADLAANESLLRQVFGLLVHAHYRTTPSDLHRIIDAPNLHVHALFHYGQVVATTLLAIEGALPEHLIDELALGGRRIPGHVLVDNLVCHAGRRDAGSMNIVRSVRIATHPNCRHRGMAKCLIDHVHDYYQPDLFGTVFGATPQLIAFRQAMGYQCVRVGSSRGTRTGEPAAVMLRPVTPRAHALVRDLRGDLARELDLQLDLLSADFDLCIDPELRPALVRDLPSSRPLSALELAATLQAYARGPRPFESAAYAIAQFLELHPVALSSLPSAEQALIKTRLTERASWPEATRAAGFTTVPTAMRAMKRAIRALL